MATVRPAAVATSASEMPPASTAGFATPSVVMAVNERIMPDTVPSKPSSGEIAAIVPSGLR